MLIAEIGINHNGDIDNAKKLIQEAKNAGWDMVKFQKRSIKRVYTEAFLSEKRESPWGETQLDQKQGLEFEAAEYDELNRFCASLDMPWFGSAWDLESLKFLQSYNPAYHKIASPMITHREFVEEIARLKKMTFISTGMCQVDDIDRAVQTFKKYACPYALMHTTSIYPTPNDKSNLALIHFLKDRYGCEVGYSGHEKGIKVSLMAIAMGASHIERHITLSKAQYGSDQEVSIEPSEMKEIKSWRDDFQEAFGTNEKHFLAEEKTVARKLRYFETK